MYKSIKSILSAILILCCTLSTNSVLAADSAGKISKLKGDVWVQAKDKKPVQVKKGDKVFSGQLIHTGNKAKVTIKFADKSQFALGPDSKMAIDKFIYYRKGEDNSLTTRILKGTFRFFSGLIAKKKPDNMRVQLGVVATIGIRGTHVIGEVKEREEKDGEITEASAKVILMKPEDKDASTSIVVSNDYGSVVIDKPEYGTIIPDEHSPPGKVRKMQIRTIQNVLRAVRKATRTKAPKVRY